MSESTLLRIVAGLETPTAGRVEIGGRDVTDVPPEKRGLAMVFQSYALYPHKTVRGNLAFGLRMRGLAAAEIESRVRATADLLGIGTLLDRMPAQLSGGQRVALGRAIVRDPQAFLFDEPLSSLDPRLRGDTRAELISTMVYVTHDQEEAMTLGQRIAVLRDGRLEQLAEPRELYDRPATTFVAGFIGSPPMNMLPAEGWSHGIRPHDVELAPPGTGDMQATIRLVEPLGHAQIVHLEAADIWLVAVVPADARVSAGAATGVRMPSAKLHRFGADGRRLESGHDCI